MALARGTRTETRLSGSAPLPTQGLSTSAPLTIGTASPSVVGLTWAPHGVEQCPRPPPTDANNTRLRWDNQNRLQILLNIPGGEVPRKNTSPPQHTSAHAVMSLAFLSHRQPPISSLWRTRPRNAYSRKPSLPALCPLCHCPHQAEPQLSGRQWAVGGHQGRMRTLGTT